MEAVMIQSFPEDSTVTPIKDGDYMDATTQNLPEDAAGTPTKDAAQTCCTPPEVVEEVTAVQKAKSEPSSPENSSENIIATIENLGSKGSEHPTHQPDSSATSTNKAGVHCSPNSAISKLKSHSSPNLERTNEKLRRELLKDSSEESDDSCPEFNSSPRVKRTLKRNRSVPAELEDDPKLKAGCAVVLDRIDKLVCRLRFSFHYMP